MTRRLGTLAVVALFAIAGCSKSGGGDSQSSGPAPGTRWAQQFCTAYGEWAKTLTDRFAKVSALDPAQGPAAAHTALTQVAAGARDDTTAFVGAVDAAGDPPITDGSVIAVDILHALQEAESAFSSALTALQQVNPNDPAILIPGASGARNGLINALAVARNDLAAALLEPHGEELTAAFASAPACDGLFAPATEEG